MSSDVDEREATALPAERGLLRSPGDRAKPVGAERGSSIPGAHPAADGNPGARPDDFGLRDMRRVNPRAPQTGRKRWGWSWMLTSA